MIDILEVAVSLAFRFIAYEKDSGNENISREKLLDIIEQVSVISIVDGVDKVRLYEILEAELGIGKGSMTGVSVKMEPWLANERANIDFQLWKRYKAYTERADAAFPINDLDDYTNQILDKCVNPKLPGTWDRRGMVVGHVQSGKTSNFVGLINKATDAGYKLIIIVAGTMNSLRRQTQQRVDAGYIGINTSKGTKVGVGEIRTETQIYSLTSSSDIPNGDFEQGIANKKAIPLGKNPVVLVVKKNKSILENLIDWLASNAMTKSDGTSYKLCDVPTLIIDDEADSASVNTVSKKKLTKEEAMEEAKTINRLMRTLVSVFEKVTFIGYTATPYANLFIPNDWKKDLISVVKGREMTVGPDLFPKDFILNINSRKNYIGASAIFGLDGEGAEDGKDPLDVIRYVDLANTPFAYIDGYDFNDEPIWKTPKKDDELPASIPDSMKEAIKVFLITCAIRRLRGHENKHNSMLIHTMLFVRWIDWIAHLVNEELRTYVEYIEGSDLSFLKDLEQIFENDFKPTTDQVMKNLQYKDVRIKQHKWEDVRAELLPAVSKIVVRAVHGVKATSRLEYKNNEEINYEPYEKIGLSVIAVGGSRLARGITLEGLSISYYLRASKMYDTLMQMGRWFGYRPGYVDLIRLYTTERISEWFSHISLATEEMRRDFDILASQIDRVPADFQLKVQNHPGLLSITAASKLFWAEELKLSFSGQNPQTYKLFTDPKNITKNFEAFKTLMSGLGVPDEDQKLRLQSSNKLSYLLYRDVNVSLLCAFLDAYKIDQPSIKNATLSAYILKQKASGYILKWNIAIKSNTNDRVFINEKGEKIGKGKGLKTPNYDLMRIPLFDGVNLGATVRNQTDGRSSDSYMIAKNQIDELKDRKVDLINNVADKNEDIKKERESVQEGLIVLYLLDPRAAAKADHSTPIVGYSIHFPHLKNEEKVSYMVTTNEVPGIDDDDDDENDEVNL
jgi:hypothetical protein